MDNVEALTARLRANPADWDAYQALKTTYQRLGDYGSLANLIAGWAGWVADPRLASEAYLEVGDVLAVRLGDLGQAESYYLQALQHDALNLGALEQLQALLEGQAQYAKVQGLLEQHAHALAQLGAPTKHIAVLHYRLGELLAKRMRQEDAALQQFRYALELDPTLLRAAYEARQIDLARGDLRAASVMYEREAT